MRNAALGAALLALGGCAPAGYLLAGACSATPAGRAEVMAAPPPGALYCGPVAVRGVAPGGDGAAIEALRRSAAGNGANVVVVAPPVALPDGARRIEGVAYWAR